jgi:Chaperone of endosialidase
MASLDTNVDTSDRADRGEVITGARSAAAGKRPYVAPKLLVHGKVTDLTQGNNAGQHDGGQGSVCDRNLKENIRPVSSDELLHKLTELPIASWNYVGEDESLRHASPMAQDFHATFGFGDERTLATSDVAGVAFGAIQALHRLASRQAADIAELREELAELRAARPAFAR